MASLYEIYMKYHGEEIRQEMMIRRFLPENIVTPRGKRALSWDSRLLFCFHKFPPASTTPVKNHMRDFKDGTLIPDLNELIKQEVKHHARERTRALSTRFTARLKGLRLYRRRALPAYSLRTLSYSCSFS